MNPPKLIRTLDVWPLLQALNELARDVACIENNAIYGHAVKTIDEIKCLVAEAEHAEVTHGVL